MNKHQGDLVRAMQRWHRHLTLMLFFTTLVGCGGTMKGKSAADEKREVDFGYQLIEKAPLEKSWYQDFVSKNSGREMLATIQDKDATSLQFIVNSGVKTNKQLACTLARARGRELILETLINNMHEPIKNMDWSYLVTKEGTVLMNGQLSQTLSKENIIGEYWEKRSYPSKNEKGDRDLLYECLLLVKVDRKDLEPALARLRALIKKEYLHVLSIDRDVQKVRLP